MPGIPAANIVPNFTAYKDIFQAYKDKGMDWYDIYKGLAHPLEDLHIGPSNIFPDGTTLFGGINWVRTT